MAETQRINKKIEIPSKIKYIKRVSSEILRHLENLNVDKSIQFDVRLAVEEAVRNAIEHGHCYDERYPISVSYAIAKDKVEIEVEDKGEGFDVKSVPDPRNSDNILKAGGRGVLLMQKLMDKVMYNEKGNKVTMIKFLNGAK